MEKISYWGPAVVTNQARNPEIGTLVATYKYTETTGEKVFSDVIVACFRGRPSEIQVKAVEKSHAGIPVRTESIDPVMLDFILQTKG